MAVRVRFAPSPTGYLHIGGLRTALFCFLFARSRGGAVVLRIEDTDRTRFVPDAEADIVSCLEWAGLVPDEGPHTGPGYRQSERTSLYHSHVRRLLASNRAYYAFDTPEALKAMRNRGASYDGATRQEMCNALTLPPQEVRSRISRGEPHVVRMRVPDQGRVAFTDLIKGAVEFSVGSIDDQVLIKSDGQPTYHLANVVDDHAMGITHVIRGEEWLSSTPKHILLYDALDWPPPQMAHLPLILSPTGGKLSKRSRRRQGIPVNVRDYRQEGYEPEALLNFLALLGWHPGSDREVFTQAELAEAFSLDRVMPSPAQFDLNKLCWFNLQHLKRMGPSVIAARARDEVDKAFGRVDPAYLEQVVQVIGDRLAMRSDLVGTFAYFFEDPASYDPRGIRKRWKPDAAGLVRIYADRIAELATFDAPSLEGTLRGLAKARGIGAGRIIHPVRLAVSGTTAGPGLFSMLAVLGRGPCVRRLRHAADTLGP